MSKPLYCWRCKAVVPMLDESEAREVFGLLSNMIERIKSVRKEKGLSLAEARIGAGADALRRYRELTGYDESNPDVLWHHNLSRFGPECAHCGKPLRTPAAKHCAECGAWR